VDDAYLKALPSWIKAEGLQCVVLGAPQAPAIPARTSPRSEPQFPPARSPVSPREYPSIPAIASSTPPRARKPTRQTSPSQPNLSSSAPHPPPRHPNVNGSLTRTIACETAGGAMARAALGSGICAPSPTSIAVGTRNFTDAANQIPYRTRARFLRNAIATRPAAVANSVKAQGAGGDIH
jgi:hypothetical protein